VSRGGSSSNSDAGSGVARPAGIGSTNSSGSLGPNSAVYSSTDPRSRSRDGRPVTGTATLREAGDPGGGTIIIGGNPWYGYGYYPYNPWGSSYYSGYYSPYGYYPYGMFGYYGYYDPWYDPYGGGGGYYSSGSGSSSSYSSSSRDSEPENSGSLRIRVNPAQAKVYLDGTLIGTADEFDGLTSHLAAEAGTHQLELRADGYEPFTTTVKVESGKTITARASLKKKK